MKWDRRLEMAQHLLQVVRTCSAVVLSYFDAGFEPWCPQKDFLTICSLLVGAGKIFDYLQNQRAPQHNPVELSTNPGPKPEISVQRTSHKSVENTAMWSAPGHLFSFFDVNSFRIH